MHIIHIASECAPFAKVGGLGDVVSALSHALRAESHSVSIILPKYDCISYSMLQGLHLFGREFQVIEEEKVEIKVTLWHTTFGNGISLYLVDVQDPLSSFQRGRIYGEEDDTRRFLLFCKAVSLFLPSLYPDVLHLHDWPTAACALFLFAQAKIPTLFTIHNIEHQGKLSEQTLQKFGTLFPLEALVDPSTLGVYNLMKAGIVLSDQVVTVSPSYLEEIQTAHGGHGLDQVLIKHRRKLHGILNGIDTDYWNPQTDPYLNMNYSIENTLKGKALNKRYLQTRLKLEESTHKPLAVSITRLAYQKGPHLIKEALIEVVNAGGQFVLLGSTPSPPFLEMFQEFHDHPSIRLCFQHDEELAHLLFGASDLFIMPSLFEPCGLTQMIAMRYGSIPLVHATGGLKDTVFDVSTHPNKGNGFTFDFPEKTLLKDTVARAITFYYTKRSEWESLIHKAMSADLSWHVSVLEYLKIYTQMQKQG